MIAILNRVFICDLCGGEFNTGQTDLEALEELRATFDKDDDSDCAIVCDVCWEKIRPK